MLVSPPKHRLYDCPIDLQLGKESSWGPIYNISPTELKALTGYIEEHLVNGFIQHYRSLVRTPTFIVKKKDGLGLTSSKFKFWETSLVNTRLNILTCVVAGSVSFISILNNCRMRTSFDEFNFLSCRAFNFVV